MALIGYATRNMAFLSSGMIFDQDVPMHLDWHQYLNNQQPRANSI
jgi:hypothetical protein